MRTFGISTQDITPYENNLYHLNSILQPATATKAPVVGLVITTVTAVPGSARGASHEIDIALATSFAVEVAKVFTEGKIHFLDLIEFEKHNDLYGKWINRKG